MIVLTNEHLYSGLKILAGLAAGALVTFGIMKRRNNKKKKLTSTTYNKVRNNPMVPGQQEETRLEQEQFSPSETLVPVENGKGENFIRNIKIAQEAFSRTETIIQSVISMVGSYKRVFNPESLPQRSTSGFYDPYYGYGGGIDLGNGFTRISPFILQHNSQHRRQQPDHDFRGF